MSVSAIEPAALARTIAALNPGDKVRVVFTDGVDAIGTLRGSSQILDPGSLRLVLDTPTTFRVVRHEDGCPALSVSAVDAWDDDARVDLIRTLAAELDAYEDAVRKAEPSERGGLEKCAAEALTALRDAILGGDER